MCESIILMSGATLICSSACRCIHLQRVLSVQASIKLQQPLSFRTTFHAVSHLGTFFAEGATQSAFAARYEVTVKLWDATTERTNELVLDANFLFYGTWLEVYENSLEFLKMYARRLAVVASNGLVGRQPKPKASSRARKAANRRVDL